MFQFQQKLYILVEELSFTMVRVLSTKEFDTWERLLPKEYQQQIKDIFGFNPYPGTLNLISIVGKKMSFLNMLEEKFVNGFKTKERSFGPLKAYKILINGLPAAIILPERSMHTPEVLEVIAPIHLRSHLKLQDGDTVVLRGLE